MQDFPEADAYVIAAYVREAIEIEKAGTELPPRPDEELAAELQERLAADGEPSEGPAARRAHYRSFDSPRPTGDLCGAEAEGEAQRGEDPEIVLAELGRGRHESEPRDDEPTAAASDEGGCRDRGAEPCGGCRKTAGGSRKTGACGNGQRGPAEQACDAPTGAGRRERAPSNDVIGQIVRR